MFATETKHINKKRSENQVAQATNNNLFHNRAGCPRAAAELGEALWIIYGNANTFIKYVSFSDCSWHT